MVLMGPYGGERTHTVHTAKIYAYECWLKNHNRVKIGTNTYFFFFVNLILVRTQLQDLSF